jgi:hypothetical protein
MGKPAPKVGGVPGQCIMLRHHWPRLCHGNTRHIERRQRPTFYTRSRQHGAVARQTWHGRPDSLEIKPTPVAWPYVPGPVRSPPRRLPGCSSPIGALSGTSEPEAKAHQMPTSPEIKHGYQVQRPSTGLGPAPDSPPSPPPGIHRGRRQHRLLTSARCVDPSALGWSGTV